MIELKVADVLGFLRDQPTNSVDLAFADPPFNLAKRYSTTSDQLRLTDYYTWCEEWLWELARVTGPTGSVVVHNIPRHLMHFGTILNDTGMDFRHWIAWNSPATPRGRTLQPDHYGFLWYGWSDRPKFNRVRYPHSTCRHCKKMLADYGGYGVQAHPFGPLCSDVWNDLYRIKHKSERVDHPCQLPIAVMERLILMLTDEGDLVLDPFVGAGTTAVASARLGRNFVGCDISPKYVELAQRWVDTATPTKVGDAWVSCKGDKIVTICDKDWPIIMEAGEVY